MLKSMFGTQAPPRLKLSLLYHIDHFTAGILLADIFENIWKRAPKSNHTFDCLAVVSWAAVIACQWHPKTRHLLAPLILMTYYFTLQGKSLRIFLTWAPVPIIGGMCYTIYLYHFFVISFAGRFLLPYVVQPSYPISFFLLTVTCVPVVIVVSSLLFKLFEQPFMKWKPRLGRRCQQTPI